VSTYVELKRTWRSGDVVEVTLPKSVRVEPVPDNPQRVALMWGPLVLAGDIGPEVQRGSGSGRTERPTVPVFVSDQPTAEWLKPTDAPGHFRSAGVGREPNEVGRAKDVDFQPFFRLHRRMYSTYWDVFTPEQWAEEQVGYAAEAERMRQLDAATVAYLEPGERIFEDEFNYHGGEDSTPARVVGRPGRRGRSWFSYDVPVEPDHPMALIVTHFSDDRRSSPASFEILVDGQIIGDAEVDRTDPPRFFDLEYSVPADLVAGKERVTVRFQAREGSQIATVFGLRMVRADQRR
jgi:hypothetical protein